MIPTAQNLHEAFITVAARKLGETEAAPIAQIRRITERAGPARVAALIQDALAIQANGGLWTHRGDRKRTVGGIFFYLAERYAGLSKADRRYCFPRPQLKTTEAPDDESEASVLSIGTGATVGQCTPIVAHKLNAVNAAKERYNAPSNPGTAG